MTRTTLTLKRNSPPATQAPKSEQVKTPQKAPPQLKTGNHVNAKKKKRRIARIAEYWVLFNELEIKPLMIGIKEAMTADAKARGLNVPDSYIKQGLHSYTHRKAYLKALILGGNRFDMNGQPNGAVTPEQQANAEQQSNDWQQSKQ